jgi:hypothetical protein
VSLPGYTEILGGRAPDACPSNECDGVSVPTLPDELHARGASVAAFSSWERIARVASSHAGDFPISAGRVVQFKLDGVGPPLDETLRLGAAADPSPGTGEFRPDRYTAALALRYLERERPDFLFLGLGEPDEYAHRGNYRGYLDSLRLCDAVVGAAVDVLDRMGERGSKTTLFITADHGRARDFRSHGRAFPESARVWLVAAGAGIRARGLVDAPRARHLADIAPTARVLLGLARDPAPNAGEPMTELLE